LSASVCVTADQAAGEPSASYCQICCPSDDPAAFGYDPVELLLPVAQRMPPCGAEYEAKFEPHRFDRRAVRSAGQPVPVNPIREQNHWDTAKKPRFLWADRYFDRSNTGYDRAIFAERKKQDRTVGTQKKGF
jgi:hypothetical protein